MRAVSVIIKGQRNAFQFARKAKIPREAQAGLSWNKIERLSMKIIINGQQQITVAISNFKWGE